MTATPSDTPASAVNGEAVAWASEWVGLAGTVRAVHLDKHEARDNAKWMHGRSFPLYAQPQPSQQGDRSVFNGPDHGRHGTADAIAEVKAMIDREGDLEVGAGFEMLPIPTSQQAGTEGALSRPVVHGWRGIDTAPRDDVLFLGWSSDGFAEVWSGRTYSLSIEERASPAFPREEASKLTHWMPIPPAPLTDGEGE